MFEKYIIIENEKIYVSQNSSGMWKCDKLPCNDTHDVDHKIGEINTILNKYNSGNVKKTKTIDPEVKGLK